MSSAGSGVKRKRPTRIFLPPKWTRRGVYITLVADVAQFYFILRELDLELEIVAPHAEAQ